MNIDVDKIKDDSSAIKNEVWGRTVGYVIAALSLVAGLAWSDAIKSTAEYLIPINRGSIWLKIIYAVIITSVVVVVSFYLTRVASKKAKINKK